MNSKTSILELIPLLIAILNAVIFFNWDSSWIINQKINFFVLLLFVITSFSLSWVFGSTYSKKHGRKLLIWIGTSVSLMLIVYQVSILFLGALWNGIF